MGISLSGGDYQYNRFDAYESGLSEGSGASNPQKMKATVDKASKKARSRGGSLKKEDEKQEAGQEVGSATGVSEGTLAELWKGRHGQTEQEYQDDRSQGGKIVSGDSKGSGAKFAQGRRVDDHGAGPTKPGEKPTAPGKIDKGQRAEMMYRKANLAKLKKEENNLNNEETTETVMENRMAMYSRALGVMGAHYSGQPLEEKESTDERKAAADRADEEKRQEKEGKKGEAHETEEIEKNEDEDIKDGRPWLKGKKDKKEDVEITKEMVVEYLVHEGYADNVVSAEVLHNHVSDEFLANIEELMIESAE